MSITLTNFQEDDGTWLVRMRTQFGLRQSDIAAYLTLVSRHSVNQGRIVEVEKGRRILRAEWREQLESFFARIAILYAQGKDWRCLFG